MSADVVERRAAVAESALDLPPQLRPVWDQLMHSSRKTGMFQFPTTFDLDCGTTEERQRAAISLLFMGAIEFSEKPGPIMTRREFEAMRGELHTAADTLRKVSSPFDSRRADIDPLIDAVGEIEAKIFQLDRAAIVVERDRGDLREQVVTVRIAQLCNALFDNVMLGVVAALAGAVLDTKIERHSVRNWWAAFVAEQ
jgi:hypothetical protein